MLTLYDNEFSSCTTKVRMVLAEKHIPWERRRVDLPRFEQKTAQYLAINPAGVVPAIVLDDGRIVTESHIIVQYLDDAFPGRSLTPVDPFERSRMRVWFKLVDEAHPAAGAIVADQVLVPIWAALPEAELSARLDVVGDDATRERFRRLASGGIGADRISGAGRALRGLFQTAERVLATRSWLAGDDFSLADIALLPYVDSSLHAISTLWHADCPNVARWLDAIRSRPSYAEAVLGHPNSPDIEAAVAAAPGGSGRVSVSSASR